MQKTEFDHDCKNLELEDRELYFKFARRVGARDGIANVGEDSKFSSDSRIQQEYTKGRLYGKKLRKFKPILALLTPHFAVFYAGWFLMFLVWKNNDPILFFEFEGFWKFLLTGALLSAPIMGLRYLWRKPIHILEPQPTIPLQERKSFLKKLLPVTSLSAPFEDVMFFFPVTFLPEPYKPAGLGVATLIFIALHLKPSFLDHLLTGLIGILIYYTMTEYGLYTSMAAHLVWDILVLGVSLILVQIQIIKKRKRTKRKDFDEIKKHIPSFEPKL